MPSKGKLHSSLTGKKVTDKQDDHVLEFLGKFEMKTMKEYHHLDARNFYGYAMSKFLPMGGFKWIDPKEFGPNKYASNSLK